MFRFLKWYDDRLWKMDKEYGLLASIAFGVPVLFLSVIWGIVASPYLIIMAYRNYRRESNDETKKTG